MVTLDRVQILWGFSGLRHENSGQKDMDEAHSGPEETLHEFFCSIPPHELAQFRNPTASLQERSWCSGRRVTVNSSDVVRYVISFTFNSLLQPVT